MHANEMLEGQIFELVHSSVHYLSFCLARLASSVQGHVFSQMISTTRPIKSNGLMDTSSVFEQEQ